MSLSAADLREIQKAQAQVNRLRRGHVATAGSVLARMTLQDHATTAEQAERERQANERLAAIEAKEARKLAAERTELESIGRPEYMSLEAAKSKQAGDLAYQRVRDELYGPTLLTAWQNRQKLQAEGEAAEKPTQAQPKPTRKARAKKLPAGMPETVTFYGEMGIHAARRGSGMGGGWRLYVLAKAIDRPGLGMIKRDDLQAYALALGVNVRTWQRWINEARNHDLLIDRLRGTPEAPEMWLSLPNPGAAAYGMGCEVGRRRVSMRADLLTGKGWKAYVWAAVGATSRQPNGRQMAQETARDIYNVSPRTQRYRNKKAGVKCQRHYAKSDLKADNLAMIQEYSPHKRVFRAYNDLLYRRLPDSRTTNLAQHAGRGRARKANKKLRILQNHEALLQRQQGLADDFVSSEYIRLFNHTPAQRKATERKWARSNSRVHEIFEKSHLADSGAWVWDTISR